MNTQGRHTRRVNARPRTRPSPVGVAASPQPSFAPIDVTPSFKHKAYSALKNAIMAMDI
jgi:hypothetical protein